MEGNSFIPAEKVKRRSRQTWSLHDTGDLDRKKSKIAKAGAVVVARERISTPRSFQVLGMTAAGQVYAARHIRIAGSDPHAEKCRKSANEEDKHKFLDAGNHQLFTLEWTSRSS